MLLHMFFYDFFPREIFALTFMWLGFMAVVMISVGRIVMAIREQMLAERSYRLYLAHRRAAELREMQTNS